MTTTTDPYDVFELMKQNWITGAYDPDVLADEIVVETPFSPPGMRRFDGKAAWLAFLVAARADLPIRIESCREIAVHRTADPAVIVVEYELTATTEAGRRGSAAFIGVLEVRDGKMVGWREYQNNVAMGLAMGTLPEIVAGYERVS
ncbi:nuclear transport factor 2 family protein [Pseudonocardia sp. TRM90224]|uniref:nuclear transport factor 2 family protein n=1 Tax=Pseudonocardia sp. TRM90224 TaxID=2812678 RepID=UPI001E3C7CCF|nr:nuclear transport factor 2 family protein [Pseudonocardia sp. TRM90224]